MGKFYINFFVILILIRISICQYFYETKYLDVPLDHFSFNNDKTFKLRYLINDTYWNRKYGPIFFYTGNEGDIEMFAQNTGFQWEAAKEFKALVVFAEHRFYGKSLPFGHLSLTDPKYFGYLSTGQALQDFVDVIYHIKTGKWEIDDRSPEAEAYFEWNKKFNMNPVIVIGGSYGGMLAAWFRMKYPVVIEGALSSSAPIWGFTGMRDCNTYYQIVTSIYNSTNNKECALIVRKSWGVITKFLSNGTGRNWFLENWKLCSEISNENDIQTMKWWLYEIYIMVSLTNYPYATNFLVPLPANPVNALCDKLVNSDDPKEILRSIFDGVSIYFNGTGNAKCLDWTKEPSPYLGLEGWYIQACTELVMPVCTNGIYDMFEPGPWNFKLYSDICYEKFKARPIEDYIEKQYGGLDISSASNIIFSNGLLDPCSSGGVLYNVSSTAIAIVMPDSCHHLDLRASNIADPISVRHARNFYKKTFRSWIRNYFKRRGMQKIPYDIDSEYTD